MSPMAAVFFQTWLLPVKAKYLLKICLLMPAKAKGLRVSSLLHKFEIHQTLFTPRGCCCWAIRSVEWDKMWKILLLPLRASWNKQIMGFRKGYMVVINIMFLIFHKFLMALHYTFLCCFICYKIYTRMNTNCMARDSWVPIKRYINCVFIEFNDGTINISWFKWTKSRTLKA